MSNTKTFPCLKYKVDLKGQFGACKCGFSQADHKPERRKQLKEEYIKTSQPACIKTPVTNGTDGAHNEEAQGEEPCDKFTFDPTKAYNTCSCGFTRAEHDAAKIQREKRKADSDKTQAASKLKKSPRELAMEQGVPCPEFEVDLTSTGGYGVCVCTFSRKDHTDYKSSPELWVQTKQALTEPKPFI